MACSSLLLSVVSMAPSLLRSSCMELRRQAGGRGNPGAMPGPVALVIGNDIDFRNALSANLQDDGFDVLEIGGSSSIPWISSIDPVHVVIAEHEPPREDGVRLAREIHRSRPDLPVVLLCASCSPYLTAAADPGHSLYVRRKPFQYEDLLALFCRLGIDAPPGAA